MEKKNWITEKEKASLYLDDPIIDDNGDSVDVEIDINRSDFEEVISKIVDRAINISKEFIFYF